MVQGNGKVWFDDDPEWEELRRKVEGRPVSPKKKPKISRKQLISQRSTPKPTVKQMETKETKNINVSLDVKLPKFTRKQIKTGIAAGVIIVVSILVAKLLPGMINRGDDNDVLSSAQTEPEFDTVLPDGKTDNTKSKKIGYSPEKKVASFTDELDTAEITVSQQELPENFKDNTDEEVRKLAESFNATDVISESNPKAYLGTDQKGPQTVIFHKNGLLIFILSNKIVERDRWAEYITKLI